MSSCAKRAEDGMGRVEGKAEPARKAAQTAFTTIFVFPKLNIDQTLVFDSLQLLSAYSSILQFEFLPELVQTIL